MTKRPAVHRGEIWLVNMGDPDGSAQAGERPVIIIQNDTGNFYSPTTIVGCLSSSEKRVYHNIPTHVFLANTETGLLYDSVAMLEQIRTIDKKNLKELKAILPPVAMKEINAALDISLALVESNGGRRHKS